MDQKLKELVATYINVPGDQITADTVIDRSKVSSSIVLHRMYAKLAENGYKVDDYWNIKTFGGLLSQNSGGIAAQEPGKTKPIVDKSATGVSTGIDIEEISAMPVVDDFREDEFYRMNFSPAEISHCILQNNPYASFAGLFALKEAIIKCDNSFKNRELNSIIIEHSPLGKPKFGNFQVTLSHTDKVAVAMAILIDREFFLAATPAEEHTPVVQEPVKRSWNFVAWFAVLISLISIALTIFYINQL